MQQEQAGPLRGGQPGRRPRVHEFRGPTEEIKNEGVP